MVLNRRNMIAGLGGSLLVATAAPRAIAQGAAMKVVATTGMIADAARRVGGDLVEVQALMGPGVDPHAYRQTRTDILAMARADLVLWNGIYLEAQMQDFLTDLGRKTSVVPVGEAVPADERVLHDTYADQFDPHVWMDPTLWKHVTLAIRDAMSISAPDNVDVFAANASAYLKEIDALAVYAEGILSSVPESARVLITAHDAFNYFGRAYGFEVVGIQGISTESEAGVNRISTLVDTIVDRQISAVFVESSVSDRSIRALAEGAAAKGHDLKIGGELFSDAMGQPGTYEGTYVGMIDHNATIIASALGGDAPVRGMNGRLSAGS
ncbi:MAG: manganese transporter [Boseongicola sp.]|nr:MAG: manganese transporter [Boseongicola sp.]